MWNKKNETKHYKGHLKPVSDIKLHTFHSFTHWQFDILSKLFTLMKNLSGFLYYISQPPKSRADSNCVAQFNVFDALGIALNCKLTIVFLFSSRSFNLLIGIKTHHFIKQQNISRH
jgi:hypothetical protein